MDWKDSALDIEKLSKIRDALIDEESKILFDARVEYLYTGNEDRYFDVIESLPHIWRSTELSGIDAKTELIIFGCGHDGRKTNRILKKSGYTVKFFCDSNVFNQKVDGIEVISVEELCEKHREALVIMGSAKYGAEMFFELKNRGWPEEKLIKPRFGICLSRCGKQYFDFFSCGKEEVFVDAGAYDGETTLKFISWAGDYSKIFVLEPLPEMHEIISNKVKGLNNIVIKKCAAWNQEEKLYFHKDLDRTSSNVDKRGEVEVCGNSIDNIVAGARVTYIKMDLEGSEYKALEGAKETIQRWKPKLAISIYHKPGDVITLASYILRLVPEYKLGIRHYNSDMCETVLYAY